MAMTETERLAFIEAHSAPYRYDSARVAMELFTLYVAEGKTHTEARAALEVAVPKALAIGGWKDIKRHLRLTEFGAGVDDILDHPGKIPGRDKKINYRLLCFFLEDGAADVSAAKLLVNSVEGGANRPKKEIAYQLLMMGHSVAEANALAEILKEED